MKRDTASRFVQSAALVGLAYAQNGAGPYAYAPQYVSCPEKLSVRSASDGLSDAEKTWKNSRSDKVVTALNSYLKTANITDLDIDDYTGKLGASSVPVVGLSVSGGGTQSGIGGLGIWQAFDERYPPAVEAGTGGLAQILYYITGLSGGGAITVALLAANNFSSTANVRNVTDFSVSYDQEPANGNVTAFYSDKYEIAGEKAEQGFPVSVVDVFGQLWGTWLPNNSLYANYSDIARENNAFGSGDAPMPIMVFAEVIPKVSPEIGGIMYPGRNNTNGFNLTSYEITPYEFGSWRGGRVQAFFPTEYLGTAMSDGKVANSSQCVRGFDRLTFIQGTTTNAFNAWFIDEFYNIPIFVKRGIEARQQTPGDITIPPEQAQNPLVQLVNTTASSFDQTFNDSLWATYANPFANYNEPMDREYELLLIDGSLTGETNPIRPLAVPEREIDLIIVYEASSDSPNDWVNGTNLINSAQSAAQGGIPFPEIPDVNTLVNYNLTRLPTFFGCNASDDVPLVLYLPNSPWSSYSNYSYRTDTFTDSQLDDAFDNAFNLATYGNGTMDPQWPACLACAAINASLTRLGIDIPDQCTQCFNRHCWNGTTSGADVAAGAFDYKPIMNASLTYADWNKTWYSSTGGEGSDGSGSSNGSGQSSGQGGSGGGSSGGGSSGGGSSGDSGSNTEGSGDGGDSGAINTAKVSSGTTLLLFVLGCVSGLFTLL